MSKPSPSSIRRIAIDGRFLDDVRTRIHSRDSKSLTYLSAPVERHRATEDSQGVTLQLPALTVLQLYYEGVLTANARKSVEITVGNRSLGTYYLQWMRALDGNDFGGPVLLRFGAKPRTKERPHDPNAWLNTLVRLKLNPQGEWDPAEEYWGEPGEPIEAWAKPIIKRGPRPMYEMEQILPGFDPEDIESDPIMEANELKDEGKATRARKLLEGLLMKDVRCLDAHAHLGNLIFDRDPRTALAHYQRGVHIGELSLGEKFEGVLSWRMIDNRPFLRCLNGYGLCLWRLERFEEAEAVFIRLLWMSPSDNLGVRFLLPAVRARKLWSPDELW
jgi:hypothetical protein